MKDTQIAKSWEILGIFCDSINRTDLYQFYKLHIFVRNQLGIDMRNVFEIFPLDKCLDLLFTSSIFYNHYRLENVNTNKRHITIGNEGCDKQFSNEFISFNLSKVNIENYFLRIVPVSIKSRVKCSISMVEENQSGDNSVYQGTFSVIPNETIMTDMIFYNVDKTLVINCTQLFYIDISNIAHIAYTIYLLKINLVRKLADYLISINN